MICRVGGRGGGGDEDRAVAGGRGENFAMFRVANVTHRDNKAHHQFGSSFFRREHDDSVTGEGEGGNTDNNVKRKNLFVFTHASEFTYKHKQWRKNGFFSSSRGGKNSFFILPEVGFIPELP